MQRPTIPALLAAVWLIALPGCGYDGAEEAEDKYTGPSAAVEGAVTASAAAQTAIGVTTAKVARRKVAAVTPATGWLQAAPGSAVVVKAPVTGFAVPDRPGQLRLGQTVTRNQKLADLHAFLSPQEQAQLVAAKEEADILIKQSQATLQLAEEQLRRLQAESGNVVAGTRLLELREIIARSKAAEQEALEKLPFLPPEPYAEELQLKAVSLNAPLSGRLTALHIVPRQLVVEGDPLWSIADWTRLWVRVPVFAADVWAVLSDESAQIELPGQQGQIRASAVDVAQPIDPGKQTIDLFYEIKNDGMLRPGQAVRVSLPLGKRSSAELVIPRAAVLWDGMGNSWVYQAVSATTFHRQKVELGQSTGDDVVVLRGLGEGDTIVAAGAEALYGEEFKWQIPAEDDD